MSKRPRLRLISRTPYRVEAKPMPAIAGEDHRCTLKKFRDGQDYKWEIIAEVSDTVNCFSTLHGTHYTTFKEMQSQVQKTWNEMLAEVKQDAKVRTAVKKCP